MRATEFLAAADACGYGLDTRHVRTYSPDAYMLMFMFMFMFMFMCR